LQEEDGMMADFKGVYSKISKTYVETIAPSDEMEKARYERSKKREEANNNNWVRQKVNLNENVEKFIPTDTEVVTQRTKGGVKYQFEGERYVVQCDKAAGYLRIYDKKKKGYCRLDGTISKDPAETHFKIKTREEMDNVGTSGT
jgi:hypothetical protein